MRLRSSSCSVRNLCRSSMAENSSSASGLTRPSMDSDRSAVRSRLTCSSRTNGVRLRRLLAVGHLTAERDQRGRAVVVDEPVGVEPELLERALLELLDPHLLLGAGHLVAVDGVDQLVVLAAEVAQPGAYGHQLLLAALARLLHRGALVGGVASRSARAGAARSGRRRRPPARPGPPGSGARAARRRGRGTHARPARRGAASRRARAARGPAPRRCGARGGRPSRPGAPRGPPRRASRARRCRAPRR